MAEDVHHTRRGKERANGRSGRRMNKDSTEDVHHTEGEGRYPSNDNNNLQSPQYQKEGRNGKGRSGRMNKGSVRMSMSIRRIVSANERERREKEGKGKEGSKQGVRMLASIQ
jgi:hypothetical protein